MIRADMELVYGIKFNGDLYKVNDVVEIKTKDMTDGNTYTFVGKIKKPTIYSILELDMSKEYFSDVISIDYDDIVDIKRI